MSNETNQVAGYVPSAEAVEAAWSGYIDDGSGECDAEALRAGLLAAVTDPDLYAAMKRGLSAAVPVEVAREVARLLGEVRALADEVGQCEWQYQWITDRLRAVLDTVGVPAQVDEAVPDRVVEGPWPTGKPAQVDDCTHEAHYFDRSVCPAPCGKMHYRCEACGASTYGCVHESAQADEAATGGMALQRVESFIETVHGINEMNVVRGIRKAIAGEETTFGHEVRLNVYGEWCGHEGVPNHYPTGYGKCADCDQAATSTGATS